LSEFRQLAPARRQQAADRVGEWAAPGQVACGLSSGCLRARGALVDAAAAAAAATAPAAANAMHTPSSFLAAGPGS